MSGWFSTFLNCRQCINGEFVEDQMVVSDESGLILKRTGYIGGEAIDLEDGIIAPGFLELHTNGVHGFHYSDFDDEASYAQNMGKTAKYYPSQGVTSFWATIPTVTPETFQKTLPSLAPRAFDSSASLMGAHCEGPYLHPSKKGAHNDKFFHQPSTQPAVIYGESNLTNIKLATIAPELPGSASLVKSLRSRGTRVSLGHGAATYAQGLEGLEAGATCLTHPLNATSLLHHRDPGSAGLIGLPIQSANQASAACGGPQVPYFTMIPDGHHVHPSVVSLLYRSAPQRAILVSDSSQLLGLPDGTYPGHADTLIGGCFSLQEGVRNLMQWSGCNIAEAVRCVTENVAAFMGLEDRGKLEQGRRADFVVMNDDGFIRETWIAGKKVWEKPEED